MPDIPQSVRDAVDAALDDLPRPENRFERDRWRIVSRVTLEAAAPLLAEALLTPLAKRHAMVANDWGYHCGTCWVKGGSRASSPCAELLAIAAILPAAGIVSSTSAATGEEEP